jgi:hypothetical protein
VERGGVSKVWTSFQRQKYQDILATSANSNFVSWKSHQSALGGCSTLHQQSTERNLGLTSFWGSIPLILQLNFDLLFLVYLILVFRILELLCNAINLRIEDEPRGSILGSTCCYCKKDLFLLYEKLQASFSCVVRFFFSVL